MCVCVCVSLQNDNMSTAGVEVVGAVCKRLTWSKYMYYLKQFVHILQTGLAEQKLAVKYVLLCVCVCVCACVRAYV